MKEDGSIYLFNAIAGEEKYFAESLVKLWDINRCCNSLAGIVRMCEIGKGMHIKAGSAYDIKRV